MINKLKPNSLKNKNVVIGYFDLIHKKHLELFQKANDVVVLTFINLPNKQNSYHDIKTRVNNLKAFGVEKVYVFDVKKHNMTAQEFVYKYLVVANKIIVGSDFKFGKDVKSIFDFKDRLVIDVLDYDDMYSTTLAASALSKGNLIKVKKILDHDFFICDKVVHGEKLGRKIGFKTANFNIEKPIIKAGVYLTKTVIHGVEYKSVTMVGKPSTIKDGSKNLIETHIIGFNKNIYGKKIKVVFYKNINELKKFDNKEELINAINKYKQICIDTNY